MTSWTGAVSPLLAPLWAGRSADEPWQGSVVAVGRHGAYLHLPGAPVTVVPVLTHDATALPTAVRLGRSAAPWATVPDVGDPVRVRRRDLVIGPAQVRLVREWTPARVRPVVRIGHPWCPDLDEDRFELADLVARACGGNVAAVATAVAALVGLGSGLTPAGDDALAGALLVARAAGAGPGSPIVRAVRAHAHRTTDLSASLLLAACDGYAARPVVALVTAAVAGDAVLARRWQPAVRAIGHGSGRDLLAGVRAAVSTFDHHTLGRVS